MKVIIGTFFFVILSIAIGCNKRNSDANKILLPVFDIDAVIGKQVPDTFTWNSLAKKITYVPISTPSDTFFGSANLIHIDKEYYCLVDNKTKTIFRTDKNGNVINSFSRSGQGPGEYVSLGYTYLNPKDSTIQVFDHIGKKYIVYDLEGHFIQEIFLKDKKSRDPIFVSDDYVVARTDEDLAYKLCITDKNLAIQKYLFPLDTIYTEMERMCLIWQLNFSRNRDFAIVNFSNEDTIFAVTKDKIQPLCVLKKGEYGLPEEDAKKPMELTEQGSPYIRSMWLSSVPDYFLVTYLLGVNFYYEIWRKADNKIISRFSNKEGEWGVPFRLPSGKKITIDTRSIFVNGNVMAFSISADIAAKEKIADVGEEDNPVLVIIEL